MSEGPELLSIHAAAARLGLSRWQVWQRLAEGRLTLEYRVWRGRLVPAVRLPNVAPTTSTNGPMAPLAAAPDGGPVPFGITRRPNPMTHPKRGTAGAALPYRDAALEPWRALLETKRTQGRWWQRLRSGRSETGSSS